MIKPKLTFFQKVGVDAQWQAMDGTLLQAPTRSQKISD